MNFLFFSFFLVVWFIFFAGEHELPSEACERLTIPLVFGLIPPQRVTAIAASQGQIAQFLTRVGHLLAANS